MSMEIAWCLAVTCAVVVAMARGAGPALAMIAGVTALMATRVLTPAQALGGFANEGLLSVAALLVIAAGVRETGALDYLATRALGRPRTTTRAQLRLMVPVGLASSVLNNTPVVAVLVPVVLDWSRRIGVSPSKLLMPLSYATILGGTLTLLGTSTNLVVSGLARDHGLTIGLLDVAPLGVPVFLCGLAYIVLASPWLLPDRTAAIPSLADAREYTIAMRVERDSPVVGQTIEAAGLRHLPGLFLIEIERDGERMPAVAPDTPIAAGDRLLFAGMVESVVDLRRIRGVVPAEDQGRELTGARRGAPDRALVEAVVAPASALAGHSVREARFRTSFGAAIIAVHRHGERVHAKIGDVVLRAGDTLLLEAGSGFMERHRRDPAFALVAEVARSAPPRHERAWMALTIVAAMIGANVVGLLPLVTATWLAAGTMIATGCLRESEALEALDLRMLVAIGAALGLGRGLEVSGAADRLAGALAALPESYGPVALLAAIYVATALLTEVITNNAAAALIFPVAMAVARARGLDPHAVALVLMLAASASFSTPIGYQTNLMVYGPGGYRFGDFLRFGVPLQLLLAGITVAVAAALWT